MKKTFIAPKVSMQKVAGAELIMSSTQPGMSSTPYNSSAAIEAKHGASFAPQGVRMDN